MADISKILKQEQEVIRYNGNVFYEHNGVLYKKSINNLNSTFQVVSSLKDACLSCYRILKNKSK